jgi:tol-pal system protein YbgF
MRRALFLLTLLPGCFWVTTKHEGNQLRHELVEVRARVDKQETSLDLRAKKIDESIDKATKLLSRSSADLGADVEKLGQETASLTGEVSELRRELASLKNQLAQLQTELDKRLVANATRLDALEKKGPASLPPVTVTVDKDALYDGAYKKLTATQWGDARKDFRTFVQRFPKDDKADDAQYWIGEAFFREKEYDKALGEFQKVIDNYADSDLVDDTFLQSALAYEELKACRNALAFLDALMRQYPQSPLVKTAKQKLDSLKKSLKNKAVCQT